MAFVKPKLALRPQPWLFTLLTSMRSRNSIVRTSKPCVLNSKPARRSCPWWITARVQPATLDRSGIARHSLKRPKHARALAALAAHLPSQAALELGTSLGLTSAYLAGHAETLTTVEGNPHIQALAQSNWTKLGVSNIRSFSGEFDATWEAFANQEYDLIFIDGNHRGEALIRYVEKSLPLLHPDGVIVCDDIHWSPDMEAAWEHLRSMPEWTLQMDAFEWGLLTRNQALKREHVCIRF